MRCRGGIVMKKATQKEMNRKIKTTAMNYEMKNTDKLAQGISRRDFIKVRQRGLSA